MANRDAADAPGRRRFLGGAAAVALRGLSRPKLFAQTSPATAASGITDLLLVNGKIHTMDPGNRVISQVLIQNGRITTVANNISSPRGNIRRVDLNGRTVIPGLIDAHNHIVLVGNRPGWHTPLELSVSDEDFKRTRSLLTVVGGKVIHNDGVL